MREGVGVGHSAAAVHLADNENDGDAGHEESEDGDRGRGRAKIGSCVEPNLEINEDCGHRRVAAEQGRGGGGAHSRSQTYVGAQAWPKRRGRGEERGVGEGRGEGRGEERGEGRGEGRHVHAGKARGARPSL